MQYSTLIRKKDKGYQYIITYKSFDKWRQKSKQGFKTKAEAQDHMLRTLKELEKSINCGCISEEITLNEFYNEYLKHMKIHCEDSSILNFETAYKKINLKDKPIRKVRKIDAQKGIDALIEKGLKISTVKLYIKTMKAFFNSAINDYNIISYNPFNNLKLPSEKTESNKRALSDDEVKTILSDFKDSKYYLVILLSLKCGMRLGEILGLTWDNVDLKENKIHVVQQYKKINGKYQIGTLKSKNSNRIIPIPKEVAATLKEVKVRYIDNRIVNFKNNSLSTHLNKELKKYNITIHELRHTYATTLIKNGLDFKTVAKLLGHDVEQTMKTYSHVTSDMMDRATNIINSIF